MLLFSVASIVSALEIPEVPDGRSNPRFKVHGRSRRPLSSSVDSCVYSVACVDLADFIERTVSQMSTS